MRNTIKKQSRRLCAITIILATGFFMVSCPQESKKEKTFEGTMPLTNLYEVAFCVEGYNIDGNVNVTKNDLSIGGTPISSYNWEGWSNDKASGTITPAGSSAQAVNNNSKTGTSTAGTFSCSWTQAGGANSGNFLARAGKKWTASNQTHTQIGNISVSYASNYPAAGLSGSGVSYLCVYGWMRNSTSSPSLLIEYYIVDNWGTSNRPVGSWDNPVNKGSFTVDGGTYDIYVVQKTKAPSINGNRNFVQYWSVRQTRRSSGTISVSEHFKKWESL